MKTFTIDADNNISVFTSKKEAAASATTFDPFANQTLEEIMTQMGWQKHTVRGFMAGAMKKAGHVLVPGPQFRFDSRDLPAAALDSRALLLGLPQFGPLLAASLVPLEARP